MGCVRVVLVQPPVVRAIGYPLLGVAILAAVLRWSGGIAYAPLRWAVVATIALMLAVAWLGRLPGVLGPVGAGRTARAVRASGCLLVGHRPTLVARCWRPRSRSPWSRWWAPDCAGVPARPCSRV